MLGGVPVHLVVDEEVDLAHVLDLDLDTRRSGTTLGGPMTGRAGRSTAGGVNVHLHLTVRLRDGVVGRRAAKKQLRDATTTAYLSLTTGLGWHDIAPDTLSRRRSHPL